MSQGEDSTQHVVVPLIHKEDVPESEKCDSPKSPEKLAARKDPVSGVADSETQLTDSAVPDAATESHPA